MSDQFRIPCVIMRGGTSKGIYLKANDLPSDPALRDKVILNIFGSPDKAPDRRSGGGGSSDQQAGDHRASQRTGSGRGLYLCPGEHHRQRGGF